MRVETGAHGIRRNWALEGLGPPEGPIKLSSRQVCFENYTNCVKVK